MLKNARFEWKYRLFPCGFGKSSYICTVFFIVLDFKVNKGWSKALLLFFMLIRFVLHYFPLSLSQNVNLLRFYWKCSQEL